MKERFLPIGLIFIASFSSSIGIYAGDITITTTDSGPSAGAKIVNTKTNFDTKTGVSKSYTDTYSDGTKVTTLENGQIYTTKPSEGGGILSSCSGGSACSELQASQAGNQNGGAGSDNGECFDGDCTVTPNNDAEANDMEYDDYGSNGAGSSTPAAGGSSSAGGDGGPTKIIVTELVPGGDCKCIAEGAATQGELACGTPENRKYECTVPTGLSGFFDVFKKIIRYFIYIVMLLGVLGIVGLGIAWMFAGGDDVKAKTFLKHWGVNIFIGLILLFLFSYILRFLAPWVYTS